MRVIKEAHNCEKKRRQTTRKRKREETRTRIQQAKTLIWDIKRRGMEKEEIVRRLEQVFGKRMRIRN